MRNMACFIGKFNSGGEGGIRTPGTSVSSYNGLANSPFHSLVFGMNKLRSDEMPYFGTEDPCLEASVQPLCNQKSDSFTHRRM